MTQKDISSQVKATIDSFIVDIKTFSANRTPIVHQVRDNANYIKPVFDHIYDIITNSKKNGVEKFLALHLLKDCLDFGSEEAINYGATKFLKKLSALAEALFFAKNTKERAKALGITDYLEASGNFQVLVLECLNEWPDMFGTISQEYVQTYNGLLKKGVKFPEAKKYFKSGVTQSRKPTESDKKAPENLRSSSVGGRQNQESGIKDRKVNNSQLMQKTEKLIEEMVGVRKTFAENLFSGPMDKEVVELFLEQIKSTNSQLKAAALELMQSQAINSTALAENAFKDCGLATDIAQSIEKYIVTKNYNALKAEVADFIAKFNQKEPSQKEESKAPIGDKPKPQRSASQPPQSNNKDSKAKKPVDHFGGYNFEAWDQPQGSSRKAQNQPDFSDMWGNQQGKPEQGAEIQTQKKTFDFDDFGNDADFDDFDKEEEKMPPPGQGTKAKLISSKNQKSKDPPARIQLKVKDEKEEGMIITHDPNAFSGFNFGEQNHSKESSTQGARKGSADQSASDSKPQMVSKAGADSNKRTDSSKKSAEIEKRQSTVQSEIDTNKKERKRDSDANNFGFGFDDSDMNAQGGFNFGDFGGENEFGKDAFGGSNDFFAFGGKENQGAQNNAIATSNADFFSGFAEPIQQPATSDLKPKAKEEESKHPSALNAERGREKTKEAIKPGVKENNFFGAFENQIDQHTKTESQSTQPLEIPKGLGNTAFATSAIKLLLASHVQTDVKIESQKAKEERDKALNDLQAVREMYNEMKAQFEKIRSEQMQISGSYGKVREELSTLSQINKQYGSEFRKMRQMAEEQRKEKINLRHEAEQQLLKNQPIIKQITDLKQKLDNTDSQERKELIQAKINELEKQLESNNSFLQTVGAMLQAAEAEDKEQIKQIKALAHIVETSPAKSSPSKFSSPSPTRETNTIQKSPEKEKAIDDMIRVKEFQNPVLLNAVNLLKASKQMREQDLKALASGQLPKPTNPPPILRGSTGTRVCRDELSRMTVVSHNAPGESPWRSRMSRYTVTGAGRERGSASEASENNQRFSVNQRSPITRRQKNEELFTINFQPKTLFQPQPQPDSENIPPPLPISQVHRQESQRVSYQPESRRESYKPSYKPEPRSESYNSEPRIEPQTKPIVFDNPVLRQVSDLLDRSKKLRVDNSKFSQRRDYESDFQQIINKYNDKPAPRTGYQGPTSPRLSAIDLNREPRHGQDSGRRVYQYSRGLSENRIIPPQRPLDYDYPSQPLNYNDRSRGYSPNPRSTYRLSQTSYNNGDDSLIYGLPERLSIMNPGENLRNSQFIPDLQPGKRKAGRFISYSSYIFDRIAREIESNQYIKDLNLFRYACLAPKSALVDSPIFQIGVVSQLKTDPGSYGDSQASVLLHYGNKTANEFYSFSVSTARLIDIRANTEVHGIQIASRYQLKQEFVQDLKDFKLGLHQIDVSFMHNSVLYSFTVPLPLSLTRFMEFKYINLLTFKTKWKNLKFDCIKLAPRKLNTKIFKDLSDLNRFFNGSIIDATSRKSPKQKAKYAGCFKLSDNYEYYLKLNVGAKGCKFSIATENPNKTNAENSLQQLAFLLTA